jgi:hypothetical protein
VGSIWLHAHYPLTENAMILPTPPTDLVGDVWIF